MCSSKKRTCYYSGIHILFKAQWMVATISSLNLSLYATSTGTMTIIYFIHEKYFKDLPLLDYVGSQYLCCGSSFNLSNHILRSVRLSQPQPIISEWLIQSILSSFMVCVSTRKPNSPNWNPASSLGYLDGCGKHRPVHDSECLRDGLNRAQDLQDVPGSQAHHRNYGQIRRDQISKCLIDNNRIWDGIVLHPIDPSCVSHLSWDNGLRDRLKCFGNGHCYPRNSECEYSIIT